MLGVALGHVPLVPLPPGNSITSPGPWGCMSQQGCGWSEPSGLAANLNEATPFLKGTGEGHTCRNNGPIKGEAPIHLL